MALSRAVRNHVNNHKVPRTAKQAYFVIMPPPCNYNASVESLSGAMDVSLRHEGLQDSMGPIYCKTWAVSKQDLQPALQNIDKHVHPDRRANVEIVVAVFAHVFAGRKKYCWNNQEVSIQAVLNWATSCRSVKVVLLLGCSTALPLDEVPRYPDRAILAVTRPVSYDHIWLFLMAYLQAFRQYSRQERHWTVKLRSLNAMHAACSSEITRNKVCQYP